MAARMEPDDRIARLVRGGLAQLRSKLLDLTTKNPLLSFKFSSRTRSSVRVVDEIPDQLYEQLVKEGSPKLYVVGLPEPPNHTDAEPAPSTVDAGTVESDIAFPEQPRRPARRRRIDEQEWARRCGIDPSFDLPHERSDRAAHQDNHVQTLLFENDLEAKLGAIRELANLTNQEIGVSTLYVAFGFLEWRDSADGATTHFAPLILLPVQIGRELKHHRYRYYIQCGESSDPVINLTLREQLRRNFNLVVPDLEDDELPETYMQRIERVVASQPDWRVRRMIVVGHFSFTRLAMHEDLAPERWEDTPLEAHPLVSALIVGSEAQESAHDAADSIIAADSEEAERHVPVLITDADSSQFATILDAMQGRSFAIKGPPGTGKSQTITNLIAAALAHGKRVLFVAEKMAALEVVAKRLKEAGLGEFLLELHSTKAQKRRVLDSFEQRLRLRADGPPTKRDETLDALRKTRDSLRRYVDVMNQRIGRSGYTLHEAYWEEQAARRGLDPAVLRKLGSIRDPAATSVDRSELQERQTLLDELAASWSKCLDVEGSMPAHPLYAFERPGGERGDPAALLADCAALRKVLADLRTFWSALASRFGLSAEERLPRFRELAAALKAIPLADSRIDPSALSLIRTKADVGSLRELERSLRAVCEGRKALAELFANPAAVVADATRLVEEARRLHECVDALGITSSCHLPGAAALNDVASHTESVRRTITIAEHFCRATGIPLPLRVVDLRNVLRVVALVRDTPPAVLSARAPALYQAAAESQVSAFAMEAAALERQLRSLASKLDIERIAPPETLRAYARALAGRNALMGLFSSEYRAAMRHYRDIGAASKASPAEIAELYSEAADILAKRDAFVANRALIDIAGPSFDGMRTPFATLQGVIDLAKRARAAFSELQPDEKPFIDALLRGDTELLASLTRSIGEEEQRRAERWCATAASYDRLEAATLADQQLQHIEVARRCIGTLGDIPLTRELGVRELSNALRNAARIFALQGELRRTPVFERLRGAQTRPLEETLQRLALTLDYAERILALPLPEALHAALLSSRFGEAIASLHELAHDLTRSCARLDDIMSRLVQTHGLDIAKWQQAIGPHETLQAIEERISAIENLPDSAIAEWTTLCGLRTRLQPLGPAAHIVQMVEDGKLPADQASRAYRCVHFRSLIHHMHQQVPELPQWTGQRMSALRAHLARLDKDYLLASREWLRHRLSEIPVPPGVSRGSARELTERALIEHEISKQRRHLPLRELLRRASGAARALKPCFMMSPASVAQFLPPTADMFDLLIIDEASQMRLEEAIGAFARARQAIVVGDPMQLPPSPYFRALQDSSGDDSDDDDDGAFVHVESVLDKALSCWRPYRELNWHYRSRHHSLIAFSNRQFYDDRLIVFPSPAESSPHLGVEFVQVEDGVYRTHVNVPEAKKVVECVASLIRTYPSKSIGVVALNQAQKDLLVEQFDWLFADDSYLEEYRARWDETLEPFMVKNLENVQGDERDIIVISTVYGPSEPGAAVIQRFGPINNDTGHRRLNVLFTRAKEKVVLVSSLTPEQIVVDASKKPGVVALKAYLEYVRSRGRLERGISTGRSFESPFEKEVADVIRELGFEAEPQVGVAGYFLDLAVRHPARREHFVLGIECDGATYHSARSARDRDRLRQEVLEGLGWKLYRIWSTDWFRNRSSEIQKLKNQIDLALESC